MYQTVFQRYEKKFLLTAGQYAAIRGQLEGRLEPDKYGEYTIFNLYYDTDACDLARLSAGKPVYKEKLRLRSYGRVLPGAPVFLELKKKYRGVVYKRRARVLGADGAGGLDGMAAAGADGADDASGGVDAVGVDTQVLQEIRHFRGRWPGLSPRVFLAYDRLAFSGIADEGLRLTFDTKIRFRKTCLRLDREGWGREIMEPGNILLEVKTPAAVPLWLCRVLSDVGAFPRSFSKYGTCYERFLRRDAGSGGNSGFEITNFNNNRFDWKECTSA